MPLPTPDFSDDPVLAEVARILAAAVDVAAPSRPGRPAGPLAPAPVSSVHMVVPR